MSDKPCPTCKGRRLKPESLAVTVADYNIAEVCALSIGGAIDFFDKLPLTDREQLIARGIMKEIRERLEFMIDVGLEYLTVARAPNTLSVGDSQPIRLPARRREGNGKKLVIRGARANNLKDIDVAIPLGTFVAVSGVSGSGKSSLVTDILSRRVAQYFYRAKDKPGPHRTVEGLEHLDKAIDIDQSPIGRTPRANPATDTGRLTTSRERFASLPEAKMRGYKPARCSFNVKGRRSEACGGS